jgi:hypothetical protein
LVLSDSCGFVDVGRVFCREDGSVLYNWCWPSQKQSFSHASPAGFMTICTVSDSGLFQPGGPGLRIHIPQEQSGPFMPPGTMFSFHRLLRLAGLRWSYSNPPPHGGLINLSRWSSEYSLESDSTENSASRIESTVS